MSSEFRGGNSRLLAKSLDEMGRPLAVLDWRGEILFVSAALCELAKVDATQLVGKRCSWEIAPDETPNSSLLTALAPPTNVLECQISARQLTAPIIFGSTATGQLFIPLRDSERSLAIILVILGDWEEIESQLPILPKRGPLQTKSQDEILVRLRSQWQSLDSLLPLLGESPSIQLGMQRAQLAVQGDSNYLTTGPAQIGKSEVVRGIFFGRLKRIGIPRVAGQLFPLDCSVLDPELLIGMLEVFAGRLRQDATRASQLLILERVDQLSSNAVIAVTKWITQHSPYCTTAATSRATFFDLCQRGELWNRLVTHLAAIEIVLPPLASRREDIATLSQQILSTQCAKQSRSLLAISAEAADLLAAYSWPENLAELQRCVSDMIQHSLLSASIQGQHLPVAIRAFAGSIQNADQKIDPIQMDDVLIELERTMISRALKLSPRNRARAARLLGISRPRLLRRISQLGLGDNATDEEE
jgi:transcriptional regulator with PAS, ATPase and Fis domain